MHINKIIKILSGADIVYQMGAGFITPVFAVFLVESISQGAIAIVGIATAIYWITKSAVRLPVAWFLDKYRGERDDFYSMVIGFFIMTACTFAFVFAKTPMHIYIIQFVEGVGGALAFTPWYGFFSRHLDRLHVNFEWSAEISLSGFAIAVAGFLSGLIVDKYGFIPIFIIGGIMSFMGTLLLIFVGKTIKLKRTDGFTIK